MAKSAQEAGLIGDEVEEGQLVSVMEKLMADGKLMAKDVLPHFAKNMRLFANPGLENALKSNRVAMNRFMLTVQESANMFFKSGFEEGLSSFFNTMGESVIELQPLWKALGKIIGGVLKGISVGVKVITPVLSAMGTILKFVTDMLGDFSGVLSAAFAPFTTLAIFKSLQITSGGMTAFFTKMTNLAKGAAAPFLVILGVLEELANYFGDQDKIGILTHKKLEDGSYVKREDGFMSALGGASFDMGKKGLQLSPAGLMIGAVKGLFSSPKEQKDIQINTTIELDGNVVAESVTTKETFKSAVDNAVHPYLTGGTY